MTKLVDKIKHRVKTILGVKNETFDDIIYYEDYKAVYFPIPKVANSSLKAVSAQILADKIPAKLMSEKWLPFPFRDQKAREELRKLNILIDYNKFKNLKNCFSFTFVRNPWDRVVSCYTNKISDVTNNSKGFSNGVALPLIKFKCFYGGMPFDEFVNCISSISDEMADIHFRSQHQFIENNKGTCLVDYVGKFENLYDDFEVIKEKVGFPQLIKVPHLLKSERDTYHSYYTTELVEIVRKRYSKDIQVFNYSF